jgi:cytochrome c oxidase subunit 1
VCYLLWSLKYGQRASANPWGAHGLEWETASPPPTENFAETPIVTDEVYDFDPVSEYEQMRAHAEMQGEKDTLRDPSTNEIVGERDPKDEN